MAAFAELGDKLKQFYGRASRYLDPAARFAAALIVFLWIRSNIGFNATVSGTAVILAAAALCALMGAGSIPVIGALMITADAFSLGPDAGAVTLVIFLILLLLFYRMSEGCGMETALLPVLMFFGLTILVPLIAGTRKRISSVLAVLSGVVSYYLVMALQALQDELSAVSSSEYLERLHMIVSAVFTSELVLMALALTAVTLIVYSVRQMSFDYAFYAAEILGGVVYLLFVVLGNSVLGTQINVLLAFVGSAACCAIACIWLLVFLPLDFRKSERLAFEDDDYYYYVKAVPKIKGSDYDDYDDEDDYDDGDDGNDEDGIDEKKVYTAGPGGEQQDFRNGGSYEEKLEKTLEDLNL